MGEGPEVITPLGRILLRQQQLTRQQLDGLLASQRLQPGERIATLAARSGRVPLEAVLRALSEQHGVPGVDLSRVSISLAPLGLIPVEMARERAVLPLLMHEERLYLAMADPEDRTALEAIESATGKHVLPYVALHGPLLEAIDAAYAAAATGASAYTPSAGAGGPSPEPGAEPPLIVSAEALAPGMPGVVVAPDLVIEPVSRDSLALESQPSGEGAALGQPLGRVGTASAPRLRSVLVVDDSDDIRRLLSRVLTAKGYEVFEADDGLAALQQIREQTPDVLLLDAMLPEVHGFDVCRRIKSSRRFGQLPVIMVSGVYRGWRFTEDLKRSYGVDHFLEKPFRVGEVLAAVQACLSDEPVDEDAEDEVTGEAGEALESGIEAYAAGDVRVAIEHLQRGIGLDPQAFRLHYHLGLLYGKQESLFEAIQTLEVAADLRPRDFSTLKNLAVLYERAGFRLKATEMWERAMGTAPDEGTKANIKTHLMSLL